MLLLSKALSEKKFDLRIVEKNESRGFLTSQELDKYVKQLPDDQTEAEWINTDDIRNSDG